MNEKFYNLPEEKRQRILNAGYRVFAWNSYKKSPVGEIAQEAGISKSLLFHYFRNKRELYLFLWDTAAQVTIEQLTAWGCYEKTDLFEMMYSGMKAKAQIMREYPDLAAFTIRAFYEETAPEVRDPVHESYQKHLGYKAASSLLRVDPEQFRPGLDLQMMYREMYWAAEGYLMELLWKGPLTPQDVDQMEEDFCKILDFWKQIYLREPEKEEC